MVMGAWPGGGSETVSITHSMKRHLKNPKKNPLKHNYQIVLNSLGVKKDMEGG